MNCDPRIKLRQMAGDLRQVLEDACRKQGGSGEAAAGRAWCWAMFLLATQAMCLRGIKGELPAFLSMIRPPREELPADVLECSRRIIAAWSGEFTDDPLAGPDALIWLHQYWHAKERKVLVKNGRGDEQSKISAAEMVPATQVYTEPYMVAFLLQNTFGAYWHGMHSASSLPEGWNYYVGNSPKPVLPEKRADTITVLDPACGAGIFLLAAAEMLYAMYLEEEPEKTPEAICRSIVNSNVFGIDIDAKAIEVARLVIWLWAREKASGLSEEDFQGLAVNIIVADDLAMPFAGELGSLLCGDREDGCPLALLLRRRYDVVVTNPPYLDKRDYAKSVRDYLRRHYPAGAGNLYTAFILRCLELADGYVGMVTPQTFLFITSYKALRQEVFRQATIRTLAHLGLGAFPDAVVDTAAFVLAKRDLYGTDDTGVYFKLMDHQEKESALAAAVRGRNCGACPAEVFVRPLAQVTAIAGQPVVYWLGEGLLDMLKRARPLKDFADIVLGMKTSDNKRFVRWWWELGPNGPDAGWAPYEKEASGFRYARNSAHYVRWTEGSRQFYLSYYSAQLPNAKYWFRPGIVYGLISSKAFSAKLLPEGHMTDMAASCIFPHEAADTAYYLGLLNSKVYQWLLKLLNPTVNYQPVDLKRLPVPVISTEDKAYIGEMALRAAEAAAALRRMEITDREYCPDFGAFLPVSEKLPGILLKMWLTALGYLVARDGIDLRLSAILRLPRRERELIVLDMGALPTEYPVLAGYDAIPQGIGLAGDFISGVLSCSPEELAGIRERLRQFYENGLAKKAVRFPADLLEEMSQSLKIHPLSIYNLLHEGIVQAGWRSPRLEKKLLEDYFSAVVLSLLGHRWGDGPARQEAGLAGIIPLTEGCGQSTLHFLVRELVAQYGDVEAMERDFAATVGVNLAEWLADVFFRRHVTQFKKRPVVWQLASSRKSPVFSCFVHCRQASLVSGISTGLLKPLFQTLPVERGEELRDFAARLEQVKEYNPHPDSGVRVNIAPLELAEVLAGAVLGKDEAKAAIDDTLRWNRLEFV